MNHRLQLILNVLVPILFLLGAFLLLPKLLVFFFPFLLGALLSLLASPLIRLLNRRSPLMKRQHASAVIMILLLALIGFLLYWLLAAGLHFVKLLLRRLPDMAQWLLTSLRALAGERRKLLFGMPEQLNRIIDNLIANSDGYGEELIGRLSSPAFSASLDLVKSVPTLLVYLVVTILSGFCFCKDGERYLKRLKELLPERFRRYFSLLRQDAWKILHGWLLANLEIMALVFLLLSAGFFLLRIPYGILIALFIAFLDFLPLFGVGFILWPWIALELLSQRFMEAFWLLLLYLMTQLVRQFLQPKIMGDAMGLPPLLTLLFLYLGFKFYGIGGMIFAIPLGMLFLSLYRFGAFDKMRDSARELFRELLSFL